MPKPSAKDLKLLALHDRLMRRIERPYTRDIIREKNRYIRSIAEGYDVNVGLSIRELTIHAERMYKISEKYNVQAIRVFVNLFEKENEKSFSGFEKKDISLENFINSLFHYWIVNQTGKDAKETAETTQDDIKKAIAVAQASGETSSAQIAKKILRARNLSPYRADVIARTETHNAAMYATKESAKRLQLETNAEMLKRWVAVTDGRTREAHAVMNSHAAIPIDEKFIVGGKEMDRPGDPAGGAKNVVKCRCTLVFEVL